MKWATPDFSRPEVDEAGTVLATGDAPGLDEYEHALGVINNWRASHAFPLNTFQVTLRNKARQVDKQGIVAQRIKRLSSIEAKLRRYNWLRLSDMQDIGGCRAVLRATSAVEDLVESYESSSLKHVLDKKDDYIAAPKASGYRGVHLIYRYRSDKTETYEGLKIEIQLRSKLQHAWATAVETVGAFLGQALKSSQGQSDWLRFFALMGTAIAVRERRPSVPHTPANASDLRHEIQHYAQRLNVEQRLMAYGTAMKTLERSGLKGARYFLLSLDAQASSITLTGFGLSELERAADEYLKTERAMANVPGADTVLVRVESLAALRRAYPNYFADTRVFLDEIRRAVAAPPRTRRHRA